VHLYRSFVDSSYLLMIFQTARICVNSILRHLQCLILQSNNALFRNLIFSSSGNTFHLHGATHVPKRKVTRIAALSMRRRSLVDSALGRCPIDGQRGSLPRYIKSSFALRFLQEPRALSASRTNLLQAIACQLDVLQVLISPIANINSKWHEAGGDSDCSGGERAE
jgi:hypothetical protein